MGLALPQLTVTGSRHEMGRQYGAHFRDMIHAFLGNRVSAVETYLANAGHSGTDHLFEAGAACLDYVKGFDPEGYAEHIGIAEGAGLDPVRLFTTANMTDVRDIIVLPGDPAFNVGIGQGIAGADMGSQRPRCRICDRAAPIAR